MSTAARNDIETMSPDQTEAVGRALGAVLQPGDLVTLEGVLGAGKTVFVRGLAAGIGVDPMVVRSPTFVLHHVYRGGRIPFHHIDLYRLEGTADLGVAIDIDELLEDGAVAVEWATPPAQTDGDGRAAVADGRPLVESIHVSIVAPTSERRVIRLSPGAPTRAVSIWSELAKAGAPSIR